MSTFGTPLSLEPDTSRVTATYSADVPTSTGPLSLTDCHSTKPYRLPETTERPSSFATSPHLESRMPRLRIPAILSLLMAFASISTDLYLPALPAMSASLHADAGTLDFTISTFLLGFGAGQLFWGPVGDRYGRRRPVTAGLFMFLIGTAGCALSTSAEMMVGWRLIQAVGASASVVLARAMVRDLYEGPRAAQILSTLMTVMAIAPLIGPSVGSAILQVASWRAIFWTLTGVGIATLIALLALPETLPKERRSNHGIWHSLTVYRDLVRHRRLLGYAGTCGFLYAGTFAYVAASPFAYISYHGISPHHYGLLFAANIVGIMITSQINARLVRRIGGDRLIRIAASGAALAGIVLAINTRFGWGGLPGLAIPLFLFISSTGLIVANAVAGAMDGFPTRAGAVSALVGSVQYGSGMFGSGMVGLFADGTPWPMGRVVAFFSLGMLLCVWLLVSPPSARDAVV